VGNGRTYQFVAKEGLQLDNTHFDILRCNKINGRAFLKLTKERLGSYGMKEEPAIAIVDFVERFRKKLRSYLDDF